ncbi:MAG: serine hydrolase domain-containing protein, partial [bacterium]|nr:serine hydrolase domain-containing protein [bacterium]
MRISCLIPKSMGIFSLAFLLVGSTAWAEPGFKGKEEALQDFLTHYVALGTPGILLHVTTAEGSVWQGGAGLADLQHNTPMTPNLQFRMGSNTKSFVAALILQLQAEGRLSLDDTLEQWLPGAIPNGAAISIRQLLNMTSGIFDYTWDEEVINAMLWMLTTGETPDWNLEEMVAIAAAQPPLFEPGQGWSYSNTNYVLLGMIARQITGTDPAHELARRFCQPLGLADTLFNPGPPFSKPYVHGYLDIDEDGQWDDVGLYDPLFVSTAGDGISTLADMVVWLRALITGAVLDSASMAELFHTVPMPTNPEDPTSYSYGTGILRAQFSDLGSDQPVVAYGHTGFVPGYWSVMLHYPEASLTAVCMVNGNGDYVDSIIEDLTRLLHALPSASPLSLHL